jgi:Flp pilus assembly pilin Flp
MQFIKRFVREEEGAELAEYALLVVILALAILTALPSLTNAVTTAFSSTGGKVSSKAGAVGSAS